MSPSTLLRFLAPFLALCAWLQAQNCAQFVFQVPEAPGVQPLSREIEAVVILPSGERQALPAFLFGPGDDVFAVRARATMPGSYRLEAVRERINGETTTFPPATLGASEMRVAAATRQQVGIASWDSREFALADGSVYFPLGANLPWAEGPEAPGAYYRRVLAEYAKAGQNWTRIWMCSWSALNLDWLPASMGASPSPGRIDLRVATNWDEIIDAAEENGIFLQMVLQHHGQLSTAWDSNWAAHPWNAANPGGWLKSPKDFFTDARALDLTSQKYRYIAARWGYSTAVMAWELFNEPHNTDAFRANPSMEPEIAAWHRRMASVLRTADPYRHLITTSTLDLHSPIYDDMDFCQPHLYSSNVVVALRRFDSDPERLGKPVFWGEFGDEQSYHPEEVVRTNAAIPSLLWASLMGSGRYPATPWTGDTLLRENRLPEMQAMARFIRESGLIGRRGLEPFSPAVESKDRMPLLLEAGHWWQRIPAATLRLPTNGSMPESLYLVPRAFVGSPDSVKAGYPDRVTVKIHYDHAATATLRINKVGQHGACLRVELDDRMMAAQIWPALPKDAAEAPARAWQTSFPVEAGEHTLTIMNPGGPDWFELRDMDTGLDTPVIAAAGKRSGDFIVLWAYHRQGLTATVPPAEAVLLLDRVPAGDWSLTWWDSVNGTPLRTTELRHPGGTLRIPTPPISRHAALVLKRH
jgi:hypothetical protein